MSDARNTALEFIRNHKSDILDALKALVRFPSISTDPAHREDMRHAAEWLTSQLQALGFSTQVYPTNGHPLVYAELFKAAPGAKTIMIYGHYDVQPVEPIDLWVSQPFDPAVRGDRLYGRGASDMKGQVIASIKAIEAILRQGSPAFNIKFLIEGEEEIGSPSLAAFLKQHKDMLASDIVLNPDAGMIAPDVPTIVYALRGLAYFELRIYGPAHDLHSGMFGGVVHNPAQALCELIAGMHDANGAVALPGFYDSVRPLESSERQQLARLPIDANYYLEASGAPALWGEAGYTPVERTGLRPTLEIHGLLSGFTGEGSKTVIPSWAMAKISMRLVPDQSPEDVHRQLRAYLETYAPQSVRWELDYLTGGSACITDLDLPETKALADAMQRVWGKNPAFKREGGSIPVVTDMQEILGVQSVLTGFGLPADAAHAPNESLHLPTWYQGIEALVHFFYNIS